MQETLHTKLSGAAGQGPAISSKLQMDPASEQSKGPTKSIVDLNSNSPEHPDTDLTLMFAESTALNETFKLEKGHQSTTADNFVTAAEYLSDTAHKSGQDQALSDNALTSRSTNLAGVGAAVGAAVRGFVQKLTTSFRYSMHP